VTITDDLNNTIGSLNFTSGSSSAQTLSWTPTSGQLGNRTLMATASPAPTGGATTTATTTVYNLSISPTTASSNAGAAVTFTATLTGATGELSSTCRIGALSTAVPASGVGFSYTPPNADGSSTVTVAGPGGALAVATVTYSVASGFRSMTADFNLGVIYSGNRGTYGVTVFSPDGEIYLTRNTANLAELVAGSGVYLFQYAGISGTAYRAVLDTGGSGASYAVDRIDGINIVTPSGIAQRGVTVVQRPTTIID